MIAVIEAGGTKTEFRTLVGEEVQIHSGKGINPYFLSDSEILIRLSNLALELKNQPNDFYLYYYGAGCGSQEQRNRIQNALVSIFPKAKIQVFHDLLGSARALCGHKAGFAGILGTGSNACLFDGKEITRQMVSLGFWLGDEGSGGYLGKLLFIDWLKNRMPADLVPDFENVIGLEKTDALQIIYADPQVNSRLASLARFCFSHRGHDYVEEKISENLKAYFKEVEDIILGQKYIPMHFSGSIAKLLEVDLKKFTVKMGQELGTVLANPSQALFEYHLSDHQ